MTFVTGSKKRVESRQRRLHLKVEIWDAILASPHAGGLNDEELMVIFAELQLETASNALKNRLDSGNEGG